MIFSMEVIAGFGLVLVRTSALLLSAPVLGQGTQFSGYKIAMTMFLALVLYIALGVPEIEAEPVAYGALAVREVLIGAFLGFTCTWSRSPSTSAARWSATRWASWWRARSIQ